MNVTVQAMFEVLLIAAGSFFIVFPQWKERRTEARLDELRAGASEAYFEERRALEAYPPGPQMADPTAWERHPRLCHRQSGAEPFKLNDRTEGDFRMSAADEKAARQVPESRRPPAYSRI